MFTHALVPDVPLTPRLLRNVLMGHGRNFLGRAKIGQDFHYPLEYNWNRDAFVCISEGTLPISTESNFDCVLFGQLRSISVSNYILLFQYINFTRGPRRPLVAMLS